MGTIVASIELDLILPGKLRAGVMVGVELPENVGHCWMAARLLVGFNCEERVCLAGEDSLQALAMAVFSIRDSLQFVIDSGGRFVYRGTDYEFPLEAYFPSTLWRGQLGSD